MSRRVVVTGMGAISPIGNDVPTMWKTWLTAFAVSKQSQLSIQVTSRFTSQVQSRILIPHSILRKRSKKA